MREVPEKVKFIIDMTVVCPRKCWAKSVKRKNKNFDPALECLECLLMEHIENYPSRDFGEPIGELVIERVDLSVDK